MSAFSELQARLAARPDHPRFTGAPIDIAGLTPEELGALWPQLQAVRYEANAERARHEFVMDVLRQATASGLAPRLDEAALLATLQAIPEQQISAHRLLGHVRYLVAAEAEENAADSAANAADRAALDAALTPLLPPEEAWFDQRHALLAIARATGSAAMLARLRHVVAQRDPASLPAGEFAVLQEIGLPALVALAASGHAYPATADGIEEPDPAPMLAAEPAYVAFAQRAFEAAADLLARLHAGALPYEADGAFDRDDALVLGMAARVGAIRDEAWYARLVAPVLTRACVAPTAARTAPSQALTIALGHAIEDVPTPEAVAALRQALASVRHAGLQKKLARHQKPTERALVMRPEVALRLLDAGLAPKQARGLLTQFFEGAFLRPFALPYGEWRACLLADKVAAEFARTLVWRAGVSFMLGANDQPVDLHWQPLDIEADAPVTLWHPLDADETEREAWRARIVHGQLRQPVRQVFREFYQPADGKLFAGYQLATVPLLGLARREGWKLDYDSLVRRFGEWGAELCLTERVYPGYDGVVGSGALVLRRGAVPVALAEAPPQVVSEACRAVDLLVSVATVALDTEDESGDRLRRVEMLARQTGRDAMRRRVLAQVLEEQIAAGTVAIEGFHVQVAGARVSIRTGRVLRDGAQVELALPDTGRQLGAVPWLPYDEALLERVVRSVGALLDVA